MKILIILLCLFLFGCTTIKVDSSRLTDFNTHPYQIAGGYELGKCSYVKRIVYNNGWVKKINKGKYLTEIIYKDGGWNCKNNTWIKEN